MNLDPRIGKLSSGAFYCFPEGYDKPELIGTQEEVELALGLRRPSASTKQPAKKNSELRVYVVTVAPRKVTYAGCQIFGEYTVEVVARSNSEAVTKARRDRNENEGRYGVPATYRAKLVGS